MKKGLKTLIAGIVVGIGGLVIVPIAVVVPLIKNQKVEERFLVPGEMKVEIEDPGRYHLWDYQRTTLDGKSYLNDKALPNGLMIEVVDENGDLFPFEGSSNLTITDSSGERKSVGYVEIAETGPVTVKVTGDSEQRVFSFSKSSIPQIMGTVFAAIGACLLCLAIGIGLVIWGIIKLTKKPSGTIPPPPVPA